MGKQKKNAEVEKESQLEVEKESQLVVVKKPKKPSLDDRIASLQAMADAGDESIGAAMPMIEAFINKASATKLAYKIAARRLNSLLKGLSV